MLYLIGGSMRGGKTTLTKKLSKELDVPYISTDYLRIVVMSSFTGEEKDANFPFERMFDLSGMKIFQDYSGKELIEADIKESEFLWRGIKSFIEHLLLVKNDYILEGVHLLPSLVAEYKVNDSFRIVQLVKTDKEKILQGLINNKGNGDWIADNVEDKDLDAVAGSLVEYGKYFVEQSDKYGLRYVNTEDDFENKIEEAYKCLVQ